MTSKGAFREDALTHFSLAVRMILCLMFCLILHGTGLKLVGNDGGGVSEEAAAKLLKATEAGDGGGSSSDAKQAEKPGEATTVAQTKPPPKPAVPEPPVPAMPLPLLHHVRKVALRDFCHTLHNDNAKEGDTYW